MEESIKYVIDIILLSKDEGVDKMQIVIYLFCCVEYDISLNIDNS